MALLGPMYRRVVITLLVLFLLLLNVVAGVLAFTSLPHGLASVVVVYSAELERPRSASIPVSNARRALLIPRGGSFGGDDESDDFYSILGIPSTATRAEIRKAYRRRSLELHPDKNKSPDAHEQFIRLGRAYETLSDPAKRRHYDLTRGQWQRRHEEWKQQQRWQQRYSGDSGTSGSRRGHSSQHQHEEERKWEPPPRPEPKEPYNMDDAMRTFRSFWGYAIDVVGEHQLDRILEADSPFAFAAKSSWIATSLAYVTCGVNSTETQLKERRRMVDAALGVASPLLAGTVGRRQAARILGRGALALACLALLKLICTGTPGWAVGLAFSSSLWVGIRRISKMTPEDRKALRERIDAHVEKVVDKVECLVGSRNRARKILVGTAIVFGPLLLHKILMLSLGSLAPLTKAFSFLYVMLKRWAFMAAILILLGSAARILFHVQDNEHKVD